MSWRAVVVGDGPDIAFSLPLTVGRAEVANAGAFYAIRHKYISRMHLRISLSVGDADLPVEKILIEQFGKNPSFVGSHASMLSMGASRCLSKNEIESGRTAGLIAFPRELNLPTVRLEYTAPIAQSAATMSVPPVGLDRNVSLVLSLPAHEDEDDEDDCEPLSLQNFHGGSILDSLTASRQAAACVSVEHAPALQSSFPAASPAPDFSSAPIVSVHSLTIGPGWGCDVGPVPRNNPIANPSPIPIDVIGSAGDQIFPRAPEPDTHRAPPSQVPTKMGFWEWKAHLEGDDAVASNWKPYRKPVADILESAYRDPSLQSTVNVDALYAVCFEDRDAGMVQYRRDDPHRWRPVRRRGGDPIDRSKAKRVRIINEDSDDSSGSDADIYAAAKKNVRRKRANVDSNSDDEYVKDGWLVDDDDGDDLDCESSESSDGDWDGSSLGSLTASSSDAGERRKKKVSKKNGARGKK